MKKYTKYTHDIILNLNKDDNSKTIHIKSHTRNYLLLILLSIFGIILSYTFAYSIPINDSSNFTNSNVGLNISQNFNSSTSIGNINYTETLLIVVNNNTAYVKDLLNGTNDPYNVKSAGIILYEKIYGFNYSKLLYRNFKKFIVFYYNFSINKVNNTINITIPQIEDYIGTLGGAVRIRIPPKNVKIIIIAKNMLAETNGKYVLEYNKSSKTLLSLIYLNNISSICKIYHLKFFNTSQFSGYAVANITSIKENRTDYIIKNPKGTFTFYKKYNVFISNKTAYLTEPFLYVKLYRSDVDDVILLNNQSHMNSNNNEIFKYIFGFVGIVIGFGILGSAIYLSKTRGEK